MRNHSLSRWTVRTALVLLSSLCVAACSGDDGAPADETQVASIRIAIAIEDDEGNAAEAKSKDGSSFGQDGVNAGFSFADVTSIKLDVLDTAKNKYFTKGISFLQSSPGVWEVTLPFLPKANTLTFIAHAFDVAKTEIFTGSITQSVASDNQTINLPLSPSNNGATVDLPAIKKITIPAQFISGQTNNITFAIKGLAGDDIDYVIDTLPGAGAFSPQTGGIKLYNIYGSFVAQYTAPPVLAATDFDHAITITNPRGNSVTTTFSTHVVKVGSTQGAQNTEFNVLFNPVINSLSAQRILGTGDLLWNAGVTDDGPAAALSYLWTFAPSGSFVPEPEFLDETTNGTTLTNYSDVVAGTLTLAVTDGNGGTTTMHTPISAGQFPSNILVTGDPTGLNSVRTGGNHTCVMLNNGAVRCWGAGTYGQLGYGNTLTIGDNELPFTAGNVPLGGLSDVSSAITTGLNHSCALLTSGSIRCWGRNNLGQLGYGDNTGTMANVGDAEALDVSGYVNVGSNTVKVVAGGNHTCAILDTGNVRCWGDGASGQLGYGNSNSIGDNEQPFEAGDVNIGGGPVKDIALGLNHTCALLQSGNVRCWGLGSSGQLGYGNTTNIGDNELPTAPGAGDVNTGGKVLQVSAGGNHTCVLLATGDMKCWGLGSSGQLGYGTVSNQTSPPAGFVDLGGSSAMQVTTGSNHTCALLDSGDAWCWGLGTSGQLGHGNTLTIGDNELPAAGGNINVLGP
jgi:alpha-tubulin suppressor-like RCC1 family protein